MDIGEGYPHDRELLNYATSANVCCGVHAGEPELTIATVDLCRAKEVRIGAHPGYPDRDSMGRNPLDAGRQREWLDSVLLQIRDFCHMFPSEYVKPHGGLYNDTGKPLLADWDSMVGRPTATTPYEAGGLALSEVPGTGLLIMALRITKVPLMGLPHTMHQPIAIRAGQAFIREGFADRRYQADGTLVPRGQPDAILSDPKEIADQVLRLADGVDSICLHGDTEGCVEFAAMVRETLEANGYEVRA